MARKRIDDEGTMSGEFVRESSVANEATMSGEFVREAPAAMTTEHSEIAGDFPVDTPGIQEEVRKAVIAGRTVFRLQEDGKHFYRFV